MTHLASWFRYSALLLSFSFLFGCQRQSAVIVWAYEGKEAEAWMAILKEGSRTESLKAAEALAALAPESIPLLVETMRKPGISNEVRERIIHVFQLLGPDGVQGLEALLKDPSEDVRWRAAKALGELGSPGIPGLIIALEDSVESVRRHAAYYLRGMREEAKPALPALVKALKDENPRVRSYAAQAIGLIGSTEESALEGLRRAFQDTDGAVSVKAARAFQALVPDTRETLPVLVRGLRDPVKYTRSDAGGGLAELGEGAVPAMDALTKALRDPHPRVRRNAATALGNLGPSAAPAIPILVSLWKGNLVDLTQRAAVTALCKIDRSWLDRFLQMASSGDTRSRAYAIAILGGTGKYGLPAVHTLEDFIDDDSEQVRKATEHALKRLRGE